MCDPAAYVISAHATRLDDPVDDARRRHVHHKYSVYAAACHGVRAEVCFASEGTRHESTAVHAIVRDAKALVVVVGRATRLDGPVDEPRRRHVQHESVERAAACERRTAERGRATENSRHESTPRAILRDARAARIVFEIRATRLDGPVDVP